MCTLKWAPMHGVNAIYCLQN
uniref:Uncharacterized protein n=1 Tax=Anguilla anguilla TaxID=7936 RepID=A0A0E9VLB4_ANGAN